MTTNECSLGERRHVTFKAYGVFGQRVRTFLDREELVGSHATTRGGSNSTSQYVSTDVYLYRFQA